MNIIRILKRNTYLTQWHLIFLGYCICFGNIHGEQDPNDVEKANSETRSINKGDPKDILVDDFDQWRSENVIYYQRKNSLGEYHGTWAKRPSYALISKSEIHRRGDKGKGLTLSYSKTEGWCGWYTRLGDLNVTDHNALSFWIKGEIGGETFDIGFIDKNHDKFDVDAVYAGPIQQFMEGEVQSGWREVKIPLSRVSSAIDLSNLTAIIFWFRYNGPGTVYIDDLKFIQDPEITRLEDTDTPKATKDPDHPRSLWIWKVDPVINPNAADEIFRLCDYTAIERIYLYLGDFGEGLSPDYTKKMKIFLGECHQRGIVVNTLAGHPTWALEDNHEQVLQLLKFILEYNKNISPDQRFGGLVLDVEPYLLKEWNMDKGLLKADYLTLLRRCRELIKSYPESDLTLNGVVPVFYKNEGDFMSEILELTDTVSLMDYFDSANAIIGHSEYYLDLAKETGKKMGIAVEVQDLFGMRQGSRRNTFFEEGWEFMEEELKKVGEAYQNHPGFGGIEIHCYYAYRQLQPGVNTPQNRLRLEMQEDQVYRINSYQTGAPVTIDGKLDDWSQYPPATFDTQERVVYGQHAWNGKEDLNFKLYSAWDETTLYFAFEVEDDKHVGSDRGRELWRGDHLELWLDIDLGDDFTESIHSQDDFQFGFSPGDFKELGPEAFLWTPELNNLDYKKLAVASAKTVTGYAVEVAIPTEILYNSETVPMSVTDVVFSSSMHAGRQLWYTKAQESSPPTRLFNGYRMGISVEASDTDDLEQPQKCLMSSSLNRVWGDPTTFGFLEFKGTIEDEREADQDRTSMKSSEQQIGITSTTGLKGPETDPINAKEQLKSDQKVTASQKQKLSDDMAPTPSEEKTDSRFIRLKDIPEFPKGTTLSGEVAKFAYRGRTGSFQLRSSKASTSIDKAVYFDAQKDKIDNESGMTIESEDSSAIKFEYRKKESEDFCGSYVVVNGDLSKYKTLSFLIKGEEGRETFEVGLHDIVSNRREDAVFCGSIHRYLPEGVTTEWQLVKIPITDFYGPDIKRIFSLVFRYNESGSGAFWIDEIRFSEHDLVSREKMIKDQGYFVLDDFGHSDLNLLGRKTSTYKKLPSYCVAKRVKEPRYGDEGRSLQLTYKKTISGWCGFYSLLNQIDGEYYDLSEFKSLSFTVKGEKGGENFELGMADKAWMLIGDSLKAGKITKYLPEGVSTSWQKVTIPLQDFGQLDLSQMGSFVINFHKKEKGVVYIDNLRFLL